MPVPSPPTAFYHDMLLTERFAIVVDSSLRRDSSRLLSGKALTFFNSSYNMRFHKVQNTPWTKHRKNSGTALIRVRIVEISTEKCIFWIAKIGIEVLGQLKETRAECVRKVRELIPILILKNNKNQWKTRPRNPWHVIPSKLDFYQWTTKTKLTRQTMIPILILDPDPWSRSLIPDGLKHHTVDLLSCTVDPEF